MKDLYTPQSESINIPNDGLYYDNSCDADVFFAINHILNNWT